MSASLLPFAAAMEGESQTILTDNVVELREKVSRQGFVHPGISCNAEYRRTPVETIRWYGPRTEESFFPEYFNDSHIRQRALR